MNLKNLIIAAAALLSLVVAASPLMAQKGLVQIASSPGDAELKIDGKRAGNSPADPAAKKMGRIEIPAIHLVLIEIPAGTFTMGSTTGGADEKPTTQVTLSKFWIGQTEVTQAQWSAVMGADPSNFKGPDLPVEQVSYDDALAFCKKLNEQERAAGRLLSGYAYTLPTEAQWEYACRAGTTGDHAGDLDAMAWYSKNSEGKTHSVGTKQSNAWGLYDMHGNVWEWCLDSKAEYPGGHVTDYAKLDSGDNRVNRGSGWGNFARFCRSSRRGYDMSGDRDENLGFRLALSSIR